MATKDEMKATLDAAGIAYPADATAAELKALLPVDLAAAADTPEPEPEPVTPPVAPVTKGETITEDFGYAVNKLKLNRAKAWVAQNAEILGNPTGTDLLAEIKKRYLALGGLEAGKVIAGKATTRIVNLAGEQDED